VKVIQCLSFGYSTNYLLSGKNCITCMIGSVAIDVNGEDKSSAQVLDVVVSSQLNGCSNPWT
jgi:hypothetical protein